MARRSRSSVLLSAHTDDPVHFADTHHLRSSRQNWTTFADSTQCNGGLGHPGCTKAHQRGKGNRENVGAAYTVFHTLETALRID